jgi:microcystin-dependent protein
MAIETGDVFSNINVVSLSSAGNIAAGSITTTGSVAAGSITTTGSVAAGSISTTGSVAAGSITTTSGDLTILDKIVHVGDTNTSVRFPANDTVTIETNGSERLRITSTGDFVVGKITANSRLNIAASDNVITNYPLRVDNSANNYGTGYGAYGMSNRVNSSNLSIDYTFDIGGDAIFKTQDSERFRINPSGNIGIGTSTPGNKLSIRDGDISLVAGENLANAGRAIRFFANGGDNTTNNFAEIKGGLVNGGTSPQQGYLEFSTSGLERARIDSVGNVGINTVLPNERLTVSGNISATGTDFVNNSYVKNMLSFTNSAGIPWTDNWLGRYNDGTNDWLHIGGITSGSPATRRIGLYANVAYFDGRVGIGVTNPATSLHVGGTITLGSFQGIRSVDRNSNTFIAGGSNFDNGASIYLGGPDVGGGYIALSTGTGTTNTEKVRIGANGNVGIGTTNPATPLDVVGNIRNTGNIFINNEAPTLYLQDTTHRSSMIHCNANTLYFLHGTGNNSTGWTPYANNQWPLSISLETGDNYIGGNLFVQGTINNNDASYISIRGLAGRFRFIQYTTANNNRDTVTSRFDAGINNDAETGSDAGSNYFIHRFSDDGTFLGRPLSISRSTGLVSLENSLYVSTANVAGGGIILSDDGDIVDLNDGFCSMRFTSGVRVYSGNKTGTPVITLANTGNITCSNIAVRGPIRVSTGTGVVGLVQGDSANPGYVDWFRPDGTTRIGYMGWGAQGSTNLNLNLENGASFIITNGKVGIGTGTPVDTLDVAGNLRVNAFTGGNPIRFTSGWTGFPDAAGVTNQAEIANDTGTYKTLMIVGNKSGGGNVRRVSVWDRLEVNGTCVATKVEGNGAVPIGAVMAFARNTAPDGWLICDGSALSRTVSTNAYQPLHTAIGYAFGGSGDTFNLPDLRGLFVRGSGSSTISDITYTGTFAQRQQDALQGHKHQYQYLGITQSFRSNSYSTPPNQYFDPQQPMSGNPATDGTNGTPRIASETRSANVSLLYCIKWN